MTLRSTESHVGRGHELLLKASLIRQSTSGIFSILPLGQRVLDKIEARIDRIMQEELGASKISLPTLSPRSLWESTGRWTSTGPELFKVKDRRTAEFCLSPTHEETVTKMVAAEVNGYRQLPVRVYQIGRKFRDELRPRGGLLRGREFLMKDLYTFDDGEEAATRTYEEVRAAYKVLFDSFEMPYLVAEADSGNIGGETSHEYHIPSQAGEDTLLKCDSCTYVANQELARTKFERLYEPDMILKSHRFSHQIYRDSVLFHTKIPAHRTLNMTRLLRHAQSLDSTLKDLTPVGIDVSWETAPGKVMHKLRQEDIVRVEPGDPCPECESGKLNALQAIEIGHTFKLGRKYSIPIQFKYTTADNKIAHPEMGCHGIGVSRLLATLAESLQDAHGLNWPSNLAPFNAVLVVEKGLQKVAEEICNAGKIDAVDDRFEKTISYRVKDLHQLGVPHVLVLGKRFWKNNDASLKRRHDEGVPDAFTSGDVVVEYAARGQASHDWSLFNLNQQTFPTRTLDEVSH